MITVYPSRNYGDRAVRCGVSDERIEPGQSTIYVRTGARGRDAKARPLFEMVVDALRRGHWESVIPEVLGLDVHLIRLPEDEIVVVAGKLVYAAAYTRPGGCNKLYSAREVAMQIAEAIGTRLEVLDLTVYVDYEAFMAKHGIDPEDWVYMDFVLALQEMKEREGI